MVIPVNDAVRDVWDLSNKMTIDLAVAHGNAAFSGETIDDGWDALPAQVSAAQAHLDALARAKGTAVKQVIEDGGSGNMQGLDKARDRVDEAQQRTMADQSTLLYDLENLDADLQN